MILLIIGVCGLSHGFAGIISKSGPGWIRTNVGLRQWVYSPSPLATRAPTRMFLYNAKSNAKKHASAKRLRRSGYGAHAKADLHLLYLPQADIARKLGPSFGVSYILISPPQFPWLASAKGRLHIAAGCDINSVVIYGE